MERSGHTHTQGDHHVNMTENRVVLLGVKGNKDCHQTNRSQGSSWNRYFSRKNQPHWHITLDLRDQFLLFQLLSLWCSVMAALKNKHVLPPCSQWSPLESTSRWGQSWSVARLLMILTHARPHYVIESSLKAIDLNRHFIKEDIQMWITQWKVALVIRET